MKLREMSAAAAGLLLWSGAPALADTTADVQSKVDGAMKSVKSFVVTTQYPAQNYASTLVYVAPDRYRMAVAIAASTTDVIAIGSTSYSSKNGAAFEKTPLTPEESARIKQIAKVKVHAPHEDVTIGGIIYGAFDEAAPQGADTGLTCTYDKKSYRLVRCANADWTQNFGAYDDPKNVVEPPAGVQ